jgi:MipA family protein
MFTNLFIKKCFFNGISLLILTSSSIALAEDNSDPNIFGLALQSGPAYIGSDSNKVSTVPIIMLAHGPWFIQTTEGILETGLKQDLTNNYSIGIQLAYEDGRYRKDASFLKTHNIDNIPVSASYGAFLQYENDLSQIPIDILLRYRKDIDSARGSQLDLRLTAGIYGGEGKRLNAEVFAQTTYADQNSSQYYYGVSQEQSMVSMLNSYKNKAGFLSSQIGIWTSYDVTSNWLLIGDIEAAKLLGDSKNSPLAKSNINTSIMLGIAFKY